ncbi:MAG: hypothetical protein AAF849_06985 [Bacteroidota bacterium]
MIQEILSEKYSKDGMLEIVDRLKFKPQLIAEVMDCFFGENPKLAQRAAWATSHISDHLPHLLQPYLAAMLQHLKQEGLHDALPRNTIRILEKLTIPESLHGEAVSICFDYLADPTSTVGIKCFSMSVIWKICQYEPDLSNELKVLIEEQMDYQSNGFKSRGRRILKEMQKKNLY